MPDIKNYKFLNDINYPEDLRKLDINDLPVVCDEVRDFMIDTITKTGGHFGAGLGVVELTVALHYVYETPIDKLIFDTGHQGYPHKILTGRKDQLHTIRQYKGLSGFLKRSESEYDVFGAGHASTSISAALGVATARDLQGKNFKVAAIIGDGAMTGGLAFEAMNNCGVQKRDITVIMNDNNISIDPNVSAFSNYFNEIFASPTVQKLRGEIWDLTGKLDSVGDRIRKLAARIEGGMKTIMTPGMLFEALGFDYFGPINGHNVIKLVKMLRMIKEIKTPVLLHIITEKGKGYAPAESDYRRLHAIGKIDRDTGKSLAKAPDKPEPPLYYKVFGQTMVELCRMNPYIVGVTAAMLDGTGLDILEREMPNRVFDVGIAEGHAVTFSSGMATEGIIPVVAIYSTFLQRAFDHLTHDCSLQKLHVVFAIDRAGLVGEDGATHHGVMDIVYLRAVPNMTLVAPKDEQELRDMLYSAIFDYTHGPVAIRFPRGKGVGVQLEPMKSIPYGKWEKLKIGDDVAILAVGNMVREAMKAYEILSERNISATVINSRFIKPLDYDCLEEVCNNFTTLITIEEGQKMGGFGTAVLEFLADKDYHHIRVLNLGIPDKFIEQGSQAELLREVGLDGQSIADQITSFLEISQEKSIDKVLELD
ncbi:MAG: 1-deoxy-D-xylulose-5-phosphate synthase [Candidatus Kapabacteria bacterium]|nr:1-deoxy-D-xylulose-5-phosphate synthase [Candidatus Kapabacteria bacterium]